MGRRPDPDRPGAPPSYSGGNTYLAPQSGYVFEKVPSHPKCNPQGYVQQHRLVAEAKVGRYLSGLEVVHHLNGRRDDNRPENLEVLGSLSAHMKEHAPETRARCLKPLTEGQVRAALQGRTTEQAAKILGVAHGTLRRRFPHLLTKRIAPGAIDGLREEICSFASRHPNPFEAVRILALRHGFGLACLKIALRRWSELDGSPGEPARRLRARLRQRPGPKHTASPPAGESSSLAGALRGS